MIKYFLKKIEQFKCKHIYISGEPVMNPNTWDMEMECGVCGKVENRNTEFINGRNRRK